MVQTLNYSARCSLLNGINLKRDTDLRTYPSNWNTVHQKSPSFALHSDHMRIWRDPKIHHHSKQNEVFMTLASLFIAGMLQGYPEWSHVHCMYYQGYFLHMTILIWLVLIWNKHQQGSGAGYYKLYKWQWLQTISGTADVWQERISEKFRQPITRNNLDYVFMQCIIKVSKCAFCKFTSSIGLDICLLLIY